MNIPESNKRIYVFSMDGAPQDAIEKLRLVLLDAGERVEADSAVFVNRSVRMFTAEKGRLYEVIQQRRLVKKSKTNELIEAVRKAVRKLGGRL